MKFWLKFFSSWYFKWLLVGLIIRLFFSPITLHPDFWAFSFAGRIFVENGVLNIYDYLHNLPLNSPYRLYGTDSFTYPPLAYLTLGFFRFFLQPFYDTGFYTRLFQNFSHSYYVSGIFQHLLLVKIPYLIFDLPVGFFLTKFFQEETKKRLAFLFWIFNPLSWYASFMIGQFDIIPTFLVILSLIFALRKKPFLAVLSLGLGGGFKLYPLFLLAPAVFILGETFWQRFKLALAGGLAFLAPILPYLPSGTFRSVALFTPKSQKMLFLSWNITGAEVLFPFVIIFALIVLHASYFGKGRIKDLWKYYFSILLLFFSVTHYHPQWFLWLTPFMIIELLHNNFVHKWLHLILFAIFVFIVLMFESSLSYGLFSPILPQLANGPSLSDFVNRYYDIFQLKSILRSIFAAVSIWFGFELFIFREKREKIQEQNLSGLEK